MLATLGIAGEIVHTPGHSADSVSLVLDSGIAFRLLRHASFERCDLDACARLVSKLLDELHLERVAVIGSSGGSFYASRFAALCPAHASCLVLECSSTHPWDDVQWLPAQTAWTLPWLRRPNLRKWLVAPFDCNCDSPSHAVTQAVSRKTISGR